MILNNFNDIAFNVADYYYYSSNKDASGSRLDTYSTKSEFN